MAKAELLIVYDEHGGLFDHIPPPATVSPDRINSSAPFFAFDRLGVRVPAVLVSPYIEAGTIISDTVFDHASLAATARKVFLGAGWQDTFLTARDKAAKTFEGVLTRTAPRSAKEVDPTKFHELQLAAHSLSFSERALQQAARPLSDHQQALTAAMASAAATRMTQAQANSLHEQVFKAAVHGPAVRGAGGQ